MLDVPHVRALVAAACRSRLLAHGTLNDHLWYLKGCGTFGLQQTGRLIWQGKVCRPTS